jgi:hypothetical protein
VAILDAWETTQPINQGFFDMDYIARTNELLNSLLANVEGHAVTIINQHEDAVLFGFKKPYEDTWSGARVDFTSKGMAIRLNRCRQPAVIFGGTDTQQVAKSIADLLAE